jgi:hypothetical protein
VIVNWIIAAAPIEVHARGNDETGDQNGLHVDKRCREVSNLKLCIEARVSEAVSNGESWRYGALNLAIITRINRKKGAQVQNEKILINVSTRPHRQAESQHERP